MVRTAQRLLWTTALLLILIFTSPLYTSTPPRLIVLISVDQMRGDYPDRWNPFWTGGLRRLLTQGRSFTNCFYEHANTQTGPGHATLITGTYPAQHSIVTNTFYDRNTHHIFYCVTDSLEWRKGQHLLAPTFLKTPALGDLLKATQPSARVVSIAHKDRVAILMGGHAADLVLWFDRHAGTWGHSRYYGDSIPAWVRWWNRQFPAARWQHWQWTPAGSLAMYATADSVDWEGTFPGGDRQFPHTLPDTSNRNTFLKAYLCSPPAIEDVFLLAEAAVLAEGLGRDTIPDLLLLGVSAPDYLGHRFGPDSREIAEMFLFLDRRLGKFLSFLDSTVADYLVVLTSDHGVCPIPEYLQKLELNAGRLVEDSIITFVEQKLHRHFGIPDTPWVEAFIPPSLFLNRSAAQQVDADWKQVIDSVLVWLSWYRGISLAITPEELLNPQCPLLPQQKRWLGNDVYPGRTGDILVQPQPFWIFDHRTAMHGSWYEYDRYVPLIFYGKGVQQGRITTRCEPIDIVPTLLHLLDIPLPSWLHGSVLPLQSP